jgi:hypothetical protein
VSSRVHLKLGSGFEFVWSVARPWLDAAARHALIAESPWVVLIPHRAYAHALKARAVEEGLNLGAVFFLTPGEARDRLRARISDARTLAVREHLHLLLAALMQKFDSPLREPARLMRALDQLAAGGWTARELGFPPAEPLADALDALLSNAGWFRVQHADYALLAHPPRDAFDRLLIVGFDAAHWEMLPLLIAATKSARETTVALSSPRLKAEALDQAWTGTWEQAFGPAEPITIHVQPSPFAELASRMENPGAPVRSELHPIFRIGRTLKEQADAAIAQALAFACDPNAGRIGIVVPGPGPLAREISAGLLQRGVPHFDAFGQTPPPTDAARRWRAWTAFQRAPSVQTLMSIPGVANESERSVLLNELHRAFTEMLTDDLAVLQARIAQSDREDAILAARILNRYARLDARGALRSFADATRVAWSSLGWSDLLPAFETQWRALEPIAHLEVGAPAWLDWLDAVAPVSPPVRPPEAANPYARIHVVDYRQAENLPWTHLILAGLNEGEWPPSAEVGGLLTDERIAELNRAALEEGVQGQGHITARTGHALIIGAIERRELQRRQFYNLVETPTRGLAALCALERNDGSGRLSPASDFLSHMYFSATEEPLTEERMRALCAHTRSWLDRFPPPPRSAIPPQPTPIDWAGRAYRARRTLRPFGEYECSFVRPPPRPAQLSCKQWEQAIRDPAATWFSVFLGVEAPPDFQHADPYPLARGTWVHRILAEALCDVRNRFDRRYSGAELIERVRRASAALRGEITRAFDAAGRSEPHVWRAAYDQAEWLALAIANQLAEAVGWPYVAVEWNLPTDVAVPVADGELALRGRIDAIFARTPVGARVPKEVWIVDYKTGRDHALTEKNLKNALRDGRGVQIGLYALALAALGAEHISVSLLTAGESLPSQVRYEALREDDSFWAGLLRMQQTGVFGMRGELRAEFGVSLRLPLATLPIEPDILEEKWALTHPTLAKAHGNDE